MDYLDKPFLFQSMLRAQRGAELTAWLNDTENTLVASFPAGIRDQEMTRQAVEKPFHWQKRAIFGDRQAGRIDVGAGITPVEIVPIGMMAGMLAAPILVGHESQNFAYSANDIVSAARLENGAVPAIVLHDV